MISVTFEVESQNIDKSPPSSPLPDTQCREKGEVGSGEKKWLTVITDREFKWHSGNLILLTAQHNVFKYNGKQATTAVFANLWPSIPWMFHNTPVMGLHALE